ncbi:hypothetical protein K438DRAFT_1972754 [Mycena galopus ATCC 62051]|nr:hypothetical protein K438DRAFT_1972754 [Mycena galopus ATCC 62051]
MATTNLVPTIDSTALPSSPANEWAESTNSMLNTHKPSTPTEMPGPPVPGSFPDETTVERKPTQLPAEEDIQRVITNAGQTAKAYLPATVAAYLPSNSSDSEVLKPPRPPFAANDTQGSGLSNLSTEAQAGSLLPPLGDSVSTLGNVSTTVHTGTAGSPHPVAPLSPLPSPPEHSPSSTPPVISKFVEGLPTPPAHTDSPMPLSSTEEAPFPAPVELSEESGRSEGVPAPPNSLASPENGTGTGFAAGAPDVMPPPAPNVILDPSTSNGDVDDAPKRNSTDARSDDTDDADGDGSPRKTKLPFVQRLKEKMHVGH